MITYTIINVEKEDCAIIFTSIEGGRLSVLHVATAMRLRRDKSASIDVRGNERRWEEKQRRYIARGIKIKTKIIE